MERYPLQIWKGISNGLEELTDSLGPENTLHGGEFDGTWASGCAVQTSGNPLTNGKYIKISGLANGAGKAYTFDSTADLRQFEKMRVFPRSSVAGSLRFKLKKDNSNYYYIDVSAETDWTEELKNLSDFTKVGSLDWDEITAVEVVNNTGSTADISLYGLQFLAPGYEEEHYVPITWTILGGANEGALYIGPGETAEVYSLATTGHLFVDTATLNFIDLWGAGFSGSATPGVNWHVEGSTFQAVHDDVLEKWAFRGSGSFTMPRGTNSFSWIRAEDSAHVFAYHDTVQNISDCGVGSGADSSVELLEGSTVFHVYLGSGGELSKLVLPPRAWQDLKLHQGTLTITTDEDKGLIRRIVVDSGCTIRVEDSTTFYYRKFENNGTLDTGAGYGGELKKWGFYQVMPPLDDIPEMRLDKPHLDTASIID
ncbi:hypothetical protein DRH29_03720 [candidate division Kazan bacterium]|uniref:Uncharacterized protein n=1 Tax=candidate division Kazan bacterium TaxID=2202143 RepID=A0A420ZC61_UNCK3|nr:MAG: hypothetical protein DRH29_03720 [candidate division Kazan bacterium]